MSKPAVVDGLSNLFDKFSGPALRAGHTSERICKLLEGGVSPSDIAALLQGNSAKGAKYTEAEVLAFGKLYQDARSKVGITTAQSRKLLKEAQKQEAIALALKQFYKDVKEQSYKLLSKDLA
ncbi:hypothetical protein ACLSSQ_09395 [Azospira sp. APE16]|uniref:hypothetical protein n=1 Tax=Azospira sp. APE16 TaxID=3394231 RepID=UPI003A4D7243